MNYRVKGIILSTESASPPIITIINYFFCVYAYKQSSVQTAKFWVHHLNWTVQYGFMYPWQLEHRATLSTTPTRTGVTLRADGIETNG